MDLHKTLLERPPSGYCMRIPVLEKFSLLTGADAEMELKTQTYRIKQISFDIFVAIFEEML